MLLQSSWDAPLCSWVFLRCSQALLGCSRAPLECALGLLLKYPSAGAVLLDAPGRASATLLGALVVLLVTFGMLMVGIDRTTYSICKR